MIEIGNILTLENNIEYAVVDLYDEESKTYIYLVHLNDHKNVMFAKVEEDEIVEITDPNELEKVIKAVNEHLSEQ